MSRLSQFDSATIVAGGKVRVTGPAGGTGIQAQHQAGTPVHFAIVRDGNVLRGTGTWSDGKHWSGVTDDKVAGLTPGEAFAFALEVRFWHDKGSGGYQTYAWSQTIDLTKA